MTKPSPAVFARLSEAAYLHRSGAAFDIRAEGWTVATWIDRGPTEGFVCYRREECCGSVEVAVVFRGTSEPADVLTDLRARKVGAGPWWRSGRVHSGFAAAADLAWPVVRSTLRSLQRSFGSVSVWFAGHSLGGALATLTAARVQREGLALVMGVVTFGCPRVGDRSFASSLSRALQGRVARYVNNSDIVPRLLWLTYLHFSAALYLTHRGALVQGPGFWFALWDRILGRLRSRLLKPWAWKTDGLADHSIAAYAATLERLEARG